MRHIRKYKLPDKKKLPSDDNIKHFPAGISHFVKELSSVSQKTTYFQQGLEIQHKSMK
jgi:hypothetical protein